MYQGLASAGCPAENIKHMGEEAFGTTTLSGCMLGDIGKLTQRDLENIFGRSLSSLNVADMLNCYVLRSTICQ